MWHRFCLVLLVAPLAGCGGQEVPPPVAAEEAAPVSDEIATIVATFDQLQAMTRRPAKSQPSEMCGILYTDVAPGTEGPHAGGLIMVYMNPQAAEAFIEPESAYPVGAVIVKKKLLVTGSTATESDTLGKNGVGGMIKRDPGYDAEHGDWEYFYVDDQTPLQSGRIGTCVDCHQNASDRDYVFGSWPHRPLRSNEG